MNFSDQIPSYAMSPPQFATDAIDVNLQYPMNSDQLDHQPPPAKRTRTGDFNNQRMMNQQHPPNPFGNKGTSHIFFKTRMCAKFKVGACRNGENCNFAHGLEDMRQPPPNWQELIGMRNEDRQPLGNWEDDQRIILRMKLCKKYNNGEECPYGDKCSFLHEEPAKFRDDMSRVRESSVINIGTNGSPPKSYGDGNANNSESNRAVNVNTGSLNFSRGNVKSTYWKTKLCIKWETTGYCPFGDHCHFAHGQAELQVPGVGGIEPETAAGVIPNSTRRVIATTLPKTTTSFSAIDAPSNYTASLPKGTEEEQGQNRLQKWKGPKKINRIYGDWLDDLPLFQNISSGVET